MKSKWAYTEKTKFFAIISNHLNFDDTFRTFSLTALSKNHIFILKLIVIWRVT